MARCLLALLSLSGATLSGGWRNALKKNRTATTASSYEAAAPQSERSQTGAERAALAAIEKWATRGRRVG
jgi:hypothetical protein